MDSESEESDFDSQRNHSSSLSENYEDPCNAQEQLPYSVEDFKMYVKECLDDVQHDGSFSAFHTNQSYINPGLHIEGYGAVGLPLTVRDAEVIARIGKQSPFGKGDHTIVDTTVRKTWELDPSCFQCRNPAWISYLGSLAQQTVKDLGVGVDVRAELHKLLLYEEGAFFRPHKDSEKVPGMFGTLVICLPSEHTGGEVSLVHGNKKHVFETGPASAFDLSTLAWYADVSHEVRPVTSGYRLVLTYNLVQDQMMPRQSASVLDESHARLESLLTAWSTNFGNTDQMVYPLEHKYTQASLCLNNLKGHDAAKGRYLEQLCARNGVYWFFGRMTKETQDEDCGYGYGYGDDDEENFTLDHIVSPTGKEIKLNFSDFSEDDVLADLEDRYGERSADSEDEGDFTGNESMPSTFRYHDTVGHLLYLK